MRIKICGVTSVADARLCESFAVDYIGLNFYAGSPRAITLRQAQAIREHIHHAQVVGIFVNEPTTVIAQYATILALDAVQIYQPHCFQTRSFRVIRAIAVTASASSLAAVSPASEPGADYCLYDTAHDQLHGGTGQTFNWNGLPADRSRIFLAGGIHAGNIQHARRQGVYALDLCSGVESEPGKKCPKKLAALYTQWVS